jgi:hypothetical protein
MNTNATAVLPAERAAASSAVCPLCHTAETSISPAALTAGASWRCTRCGQRWDAQRLDTAAAYAATV